MRWQPRMRGGGTGRLLRSPIPIHGEYIVPGGKLVVDDLEVEDGKLAAVRLSGDFFLEPPEALDHINRALCGLPADADETRLAQAVQAGLPQDAELFGFSAQAVAVTRTEERGGGKECVRTGRSGGSRNQSNKKTHKEKT